jgi:anti-anti-sigma regulatory factor
MASAPFTCQREGDVFVIGGSIDERAQLVPLLRWAKNGRLILDAGAVTFVNSLGVREWVRLQTTARDAGTKLELRRVAEVLIHQLNIVPAARAASDVRSFFVTYVCETCGEEQPELLEVARLEKHEAPPMKCRACKQPAVLSEAPELYFSFLAGTSPLR